MIASANLARAAAVAVVLGLVVGVGRGGARTTGTATLLPIVSGLVNPTYVTSPPGNLGTLYVVEQGGRIVTVEGGRITGTFLDIRDRVKSGDELGLLSMAFHPHYAENHLFYVDYTDLAGDTRVVEFAAPNGVADPSTARELLFVDQPFPNHKGGQLAFDRAGLLYVGMGDGGTDPDAGHVSLGDPGNRAQNMTSKLGKLLRIDPTRPGGTTWQIVGLGLRNPWRFSFDRKTGDLWLADVGAASAEEIDHRPKTLIGKLANYGWSHFEGRLVYNKRIALHAGKLVPPVYVYSHSDGSCGVIGGYVYRGARVPKARGRYFFGDLCTGVIWSFKLGKRGSPTGGRAFAGRAPSLSSFGEDANGELYALSLDGDLYAIR